MDLNIREEIPYIPADTLVGVMANTRNWFIQSMDNGGRNLPDLIFKTVLKNCVTLPFGKKGSYVAVPCTRKTFRISICLQNVLSYQNWKKSIYIFHPLTVKKVTIIKYLEYWQLPFYVHQSLTNIVTQINLFNVISTVASIWTWSTVTHPNTGKSQRCLTLRSDVNRWWQRDIAICRQFE